MHTNNNDCLLLLSGGLDSSTVLAALKAEGKTVTGYGITYGQNHQTMELAAAEKIAAYYQTPYHLIDLSTVFSRSDSGLVQGTIENTEVAFRNPIFISVLTSFAMQQGAKEIYCGIQHEDSTGYSDCTPAFVGAMQQAVHYGSGGQVKLQVPLLKMTKAEIVKWGTTLGVPFDLTYSCYAGTPEPCGICQTCIQRRNAFVHNGLQPQ